MIELVAVEGSTLHIAISNGACNAIRSFPSLSRSIRLDECDCTSAGVYYVTDGILHEECWFDRPASRAIAEDEWYSLPARFQTIRLDEFVVMSNHIHSIVWLNPRRGLVETQLNCAPAGDGGHPISRSFHVDPERPTLGQTVQPFESVVSHRIRQAGGECFNWQPNPYERFIRNDRGLDGLRRYTRDAATQWAQDRGYYR